MKVKVEFLDDFANKKKGEITECDSILAASLVNRGVAKKVVEKVKDKK